MAKPIEPMLTRPLKIVEIFLLEDQFSSILRTRKVYLKLYLCLDILPASCLKAFDFPRKETNLKYITLQKPFFCTVISLKVTRKK